MVPVFTANRSISLASSLAPAASPRLRRRPSPWPPHRHAKPATESTVHRRSCTAPRPLSTSFEPVPRLRGVPTGSSRMPSDLACRTRPVWQSRTVPALSALLPALPGVSQVRLRSAPTRLLRQPSEEVLHLLRFAAPHGARAPRGTRRSRPAWQAARHAGAGRGSGRAAPPWRAGPPRRAVRARPARSARREAGATVGRPTGAARRLGRPRTGEDRASRGRGRCGAGRAGNGRHNRRDASATAVCASTQP